ncbi:MAG: hypothetical protein R2770_07655 [Acidimicrobiales bacterium]
MTATSGWSAPDETAIKFLKAAEEIVFESQSILTVSRVTVAEIVERADGGLSRGAFTHKWPRRTDFERDLLAYLARGVETRAHRRVLGALEGIIDRAGELDDPADLLRAGVDRAVRSIVDSGEMSVIIGLWGVCASDPNVRAAMRGSWEATRQALTGPLSLLLAVVRRQIKPGLDIDELAASMNEMFTSFSLRVTTTGEDPRFGIDEWVRNAMALVVAYSDPMTEEAPAE